MNPLEHLKTNKNVFFNFMKEDYPLFKNSNLFIILIIEYFIITHFELIYNSGDLLILFLKNY